MHFSKHYPDKHSLSVSLTGQHCALTSWYLEAAAKAHEPSGPQEDSVKEG